MPIQRLRRLVSEDFEAVNALIIEKIKSEVSLIDDLSNHLMQSGGKRLRPLLVLLACHACKYKGEHHIKLAAMIEFFHTATLLHDDVIDESTMRRGRETANEIWGSKASILVGDYLFIQYMQLALEVGSLKIMDVLTQHFYEITRGEIKQLNNRHNTSLSEDEYFEIIRSKTSLLFAVSAALGPMICDADETIYQGLFNYGLHLGNAFQLIDDALDYSSNSETLGKNIGDDLADGKATLPILHAINHSDPVQKTLIIESLKTGNLSALPNILSAIKSAKSLEYTRQVAEAEVDKAITSLQILPDSVYKEALVDLAHYAVSRDH
ncbi:polyprenyl synthetase family protein [Legionella impletisoli]|uniref:Octaprenyl diphosphate synthase n=1 Tax=Legionella impletisoli TaxID=343510 RepID=A0A917JR27_9GAMM|nr:polyprenyl synthetase family protein [Legionella impletisoli]GGI79419.1 octaprenyl diphosphate synthase [Legionella impletisoli]